MQIGDTKSVDIGFPQEHSNPELAGKSAHYEIALHAITQKHLPDLDDEFAKDLGYESYSQLYGLIWNNLVEEETSIHVDKQKAELLTQLIEKTDIAIPEPLVDQYVQQTLQNLQRQLKMNIEHPKRLALTWRHCLMNCGEMSFSKPSSHGFLRQ